MKKFIVYVVVFLFGNLCSWFVFWCGGESMFSASSGWAAFFGLVTGGVLSILHGIWSDDVGLSV